MSVSKLSTIGRRGLRDGRKRITKGEVSNMLKRKKHFIKRGRDSKVSLTTNVNEGLKHREKMINILEPVQKLKEFE